MPFEQTGGEAGATNSFLVEPPVRHLPVSHFSFLENFCLFLNTIHCTLHTIHCTLYTILYTVHYTLHTVQKDQVLKHVLVEVKAVFDRKSDYQTSSLIKLTKFLTTIPCSEQDDVVLYHLEDLVSPCLGLLEDQNNKEIIRHVKKFINNLHYS